MARQHARKDWAALKAAYRRGEGSIAELAKRFGFGKSTVERRCTREKWTVERRETSEKAEALARERDAVELAEMLARHRRIANLALARAEELLVERGKKKPGAFSLDAIVKALGGAARAERLAAGIEPEKPITPAQQATSTTLVVKRQRNPQVPAPAALPKPDEAA